ncbi:MAG: IPTL-CTERM sorting domain-containing protein, partial [Ottowia sp.]|uniref:IPTL-CTERM sorting domain-containing protein n=1 Tax=Ottowia sp. TaxID=1898956 RepID=UPI003C767920
ASAREGSGNLTLAATDGGNGSVTITYAAPGGAQPVPTLGQWGALVLSALLGGAVLRRRARVDLRR